MRPAEATSEVLGQPDLPNEILSLKTTKRLGTQRQMKIELCGTEGLCHLLGEKNLTFPPPCPAGRLPLLSALGQLWAPHSQPFYPMPWGILITCKLLNHVPSEVKQAIQSPPCSGNCVCTCWGFGDPQIHWKGQLRFSGMYPGYTQRTCCRRQLDGRGTQR